MIIIGAGLSGLIAAHAFPRAKIYEAMPMPQASHAALLRFRSDVVANLVGIEFKKVEVHKGIWSKSTFKQPNIRLANLYSRKVVGHITNRSIWNLETVNRFIAPENLYEQLVDAVEHRITWDSSVAGFEAFGSEQIISTMPLHEALNTAGIQSQLLFERAPINVSRWRVRNCDVCQTIYFPDEDTDIYRASLTGSLLTVESVVRYHESPRVIARDPVTPDGLRMICRAFGGIRLDQQLGEVQQRYGKISAIDDEQRKALLFRLTHEHNVFSIGRFAVWKNILLDDVVHDIAVVRRLMRSSSYDQHHAAQ